MPTIRIDIVDRKYSFCFFKLQGKCLDPTQLVFGSPKYIKGLPKGSLTHHSPISVSTLLYSSLFKSPQMISLISLSLTHPATSLPQASPLSTELKAPQPRYHQHQLALSFQFRTGRKMEARRHLSNSNTKHMSPATHLPPTYTWTNCEQQMTSPISILSSA